MRCGIALGVFHVLFSAVGSAVFSSSAAEAASPQLHNVSSHRFLSSRSQTINQGSWFPSVKEEPLSHPLPGVADKLKDLGKKVAATEDACPKACDCHDGDASNGGRGLVIGTCFHYCSEPYEDVRYCGESDDYTGGAAIDCRKCSDPANFRATLDVYESAPGAAKRSLILLNPWNGTPGFMWNWTFNQSGEIQRRVSDKYRVVDVAGKHVPGTDYTSWFSYASEEDWWSDTPIPHEVEFAVGYVHHLIREEFKVVGDYQRIILAGLSQGAGLALEAALSFPETLGLVISDRGIVRPERRDAAPPTNVAKSPYIFLMGQDDDVYGIDAAKKSCKYLQKLGTHVRMKAIQGLDHDNDGGPGRLREQQLTLDILAAVPKMGPSDAAHAVEGVAEWTPCE